MCVIRRTGGGFVHQCPGCNQLHWIVVGDDGHRWDGDLERPTFWPKFQNMSTGYSPMDKQQFHRHCSYYIVGGVIQFDADCTHPYAGKSMPMPEVPYTFLTGGPVAKAVA